MKLIGLTGGIASGKSLVTNRFAHLGVPTIDADILAREVVEPESAGLQTIVANFGPEILNQTGELDRAALRQRIFDDPEARGRVERELHPRIRALSDQRIREADDGSSPYLVYAVPLLFETDQRDRFDRVLVVDVPVGIQLSRLMARDDHDLEQATAILDAQASREQRLSIADDVIVNDGEPGQTMAKVDEMHRAYLSLWA